MNLNPANNMRTSVTLQNTIYVAMIIIIPLFFWTTKAEADHRPLRITFVSPHHNDTYFWGLANNFARSAAKDLNIEFTVIHNSKNNRATYLEAYEKAFNAPEKPDFVIGTMLRGIAQSALELSRQHNIPIFMLNSDVPDPEKNQVGNIRGKYNNYIGHMLPDEEQAGHLLTCELMKIAKRKNPNGRKQILAFSGHRESPVAIDRAEGLQEAAEACNATIRQLVYTDWSPTDAYFRTRKLISRYPNIDILWYATDDMALKAITLDSSNRYTIGGFDWNGEAIKSIKKGNLDASVGGHFTETGFALVLLYDYYHGKDFVSQYDGKIYTEMIAITKDNLDKYYDILTRQDWGNIDFKKFSKVLNPDLENYNFSFDQVLKNYRSE